MPVQSAFQSVQHRDWVLPGEFLGSLIIFITLQSLYLANIYVVFIFPSKSSVSLLPKSVRDISLGLFPCVVACQAILGVSVTPCRRILEGLIFWDITVCLLVNSSGLLGGTSFLHLHGLNSLLCPCLP